MMKLPGEQTLLEAHGIALTTHRVRLHTRRRTISMLLEELADCEFRRRWPLGTGALIIRSRGGGKIKARVSPWEAEKIIDTLEGAEYQRSAAARPR